jgi:hypothetical protein
MTPPCPRPTTKAEVNGLQGGGTISGHERQHHHIHCQNLLDETGQEFNLRSSCVQVRTITRNGPLST